MRLESSLVRYQQNQSTKFYLCRMCRNHVALHQHVLIKYTDRRHALFQEMVNVAIDNDLHDISPGQEAAFADCANCSSNFGEKIISETIPNPASDIKPGRFLIDLKTLLMWNGEQMVYADNEQPIRRA